MYIYFHVNAKKKFRKENIEYLIFCRYTSLVIFSLYYIFLWCYNTAAVNLIYEKGQIIYLYNSNHSMTSFVETCLFYTNASRQLETKTRTRIQCTYYIYFIDIYRKSE